MTTAEDVRRQSKFGVFLMKSDRSAAANHERIDSHIYKSCSLLSFLHCIAAVAEVLCTSSCKAGALAKLARENFWLSANWRIIKKIFVN